MTFRPATQLGVSLFEEAPPFEFIRAVAKSALYCFIEVNFKHFLDRAPDELEEMRTHSTILDAQGFKTEIDSYLDSGVIASITPIN